MTQLAIQPPPMYALSMKSPNDYPNADPFLPEPHPL